MPADAPFSPLVFLVRRDPLRSRGLFAVTVLDEVFEAETAGVDVYKRQIYSDAISAHPFRLFCVSFFWAAPHNCSFGLHRMLSLNYAALPLF